MNVLLVGSGGREHALAWKLRQSPLLDELHAAPGNPGIAACGECHPVAGDDAEGLLALARETGIDLVVVGPEAPLVAGLGDELRHAGVPVFGPGRGAARIEGSKQYAKEVMSAAGVPTAGRMPLARPPCVLKADGLAAGKGVFVCRTAEDVERGLEALTKLGQAFHVEELLEGEEVSVFTLSDGEEVVPLAAARDYKRVGDGDAGPNTGGMGSFTPVPGVDVEELVDRLHRPTLAELARRGTPYVGVLYAGVMLTEDGPFVYEFNCRFGDPETQAILPCLEGDLLATLHACATGSLRDSELPAPAHSGVTLVLAGGDYPARADAGTPIDGIEEAEALGALVFHAGTALRNGRLVTNGGRILNITAVGENLEEARTLAYDGAERISFAGAHYRRDIAVVPEAQHA